jgi:spore maturation protein CgeB
MTARPRARGERLDIVILGLSITSSWGNGHATTYRALTKALARRGHRIRFFERDVSWYAQNRDLPQPPYAEVVLYNSLEELRDRGGDMVRRADLVIVGSYVPEGIAVGAWVRDVAGGLVAFYDIDTPITLAALERGGAEYLLPEQVAAYDLYLSFTGGPVLRQIEHDFGSPMARPLFCAFDPDVYRPDPRPIGWDLGYMGTYSADRQAALGALLLDAARRMPALRFVVAGALYPSDIAWPDNVQRIDHVPPSDHRAFYCGQRFTLNLTRADMIRVGHSPSVRLFEAAACGVPIISDEWPGLASLFRPHHEILIARCADDVSHYLNTLDPQEAARIGARARRRVLGEHTSEHRAVELETYIAELRVQRRQRA